MDPTEIQSLILKLNKDMEYQYRSPRDLYKLSIEKIAWKYAEKDGFIEHKVDYVEGFMYPERGYPAPWSEQPELAYWAGRERRQNMNLEFIRIFE